MSKYVTFDIQDHGSTPRCLPSRYSEIEMESSYPAFNTGLGVYGGMHSVIGLGENGSTVGGDFENFLLHPYNATETSWYSSSSEDYSMEGFSQFENYQSVSSLETLSLMSANVGRAVNRHSAFGTYVRLESNVGANFSRGGQVLTKRCLTFLRGIEENTKLTNQSQGGKCRSQEPEEEVQNKSAFQHMIAERNRRVKLRQHFSALYNFLPRNSKKDKYSVLLNTTKYLTELRLRVAELEQRNQDLEDSIQANIPRNEDASGSFQTPQQQNNPVGKLLYHSDEVAVEQNGDIPCQVKIKISVQMSVMKCSTSLLINLLERLRKEEVDILSITSHSDACRFHVTILIRPKGDGWEVSTWQNFGDVVRECLGVEYR